jgi:undecaprenyl diphosphate synthase
MSTTIIPNHVAIIMDGNRRWAKEKGTFRLSGHEEGAKRIEPLIASAIEKGIKRLTFWAFSTENWQRSEAEVQFLFQISRKFFQDSISQLLDLGVKLHTLGDLSRFPADIASSIRLAQDKSKNNDRIVVNLPLNYGGRQEILHAVKELLKEKLEPIIQQLPEGPQGEVRDVLHTTKEAMKSLLHIDEEMFASYLYTKGQPDPDLIIRTGGAERLSGFLPWQGVYSELYFTDTYWPDFTPTEFTKALDNYALRERRFGK